MKILQCKLLRDHSSPYISYFIIILKQTIMKKTNILTFAQSMTTTFHRKYSNTQKGLLLLLTFFFYSCLAKGQISKKYWLVSGDLNISSLKNSSLASIPFKQTDVQLSTNLGYFIKNKLAVGLKPSLIYGSNTFGNSNTSFNIGPFVRYYLLKEDNVFNILTEVGYSRGSITGGQKLNTFSFYTGPVIFLNNSVGLEFKLGYSTTVIKGFQGGNNKFQFGIGFQYHLIK